MLAGMTSRQLAQWQAYELENGPLDSTWRDDVLAGVHELLQAANHLHGAAHFTDKKHTKNPVPEPERYPRPWQVREKAQEIAAQAAEDAEKGIRRRKRR